MNVAVVPIKRLDASKSRLAEALPREAVEELMRAMLRDVVGALCAAPELDRVYVVTPDPEVAREAKALGASAILSEAPGLNPSLDDAAREVAAAGARRWLVVLGDVAAIAPADVSALFEALVEPGAVLAAARDGGTAALLRAPIDAFPNEFGIDSAERHRRAAREAGVRLAEVERAGLAIDLDRWEDVADLLACPGATETRAVLARLERAEAR